MTNIDSQRARDVLARVEGDRGSSRQWPKLMADLDPDLLEHMHDANVHVMDRRDSIPRKYKEILLLCLNASTLRESGFRFHTRNALAHGANEQELLEALEVISLANQPALTSMLPALVEEVARYRDSRSSDEK